MTIVAFHFTEDSILGIADGLISRGSARVIDETDKLVLFTPKYKIPHVSLGRFSGFRDYTGGTFCLAYAGNYALISTVLNEVTAIMSRRLVLDRDKKNGQPTIYRREDEGRGLRGNAYWDDYNFRSEELIDLSMSLIANIVASVCKKACLDFSRNAMENPDIELLVFGAEIIKNRSINRAEFIACKKCENGQAEINRYSVLPWRPFCFGDKSVSLALMADLDSRPEFNLNFVPHDVPTDEITEWSIKPSVISKIQSARIDAIKQATMRIIARGTSTIGGSCTIAGSSWTHSLRIEKVNASKLQKFFP